MTCRTNLLISTGNPTNTATKSELIDLEDADCSCDYPYEYPDVWGVEGAVGGLLTSEKQPLICGGVYLKHCYYLGKPEIVVTMKEVRAHATAVILSGHQLLWVTGGMWDIEKTPHKSTEFVTEETSIQGPDLPNPLSSHCMVTLQPDQIMIIGGFKNRARSEETYIFHMSNLDNVTYERGPDLSEKKNGMACGMIVTEDTGEQIVVSAGGHTTEITDDIEVWTLGSNSPTFQTKDGKLPYGWAFGNSVTVPAINSIILVGNYESHSNDILKMQCTSQICTTEVMPQKLKIARTFTVAILVSKHCN